MRGSFANPARLQYNMNGRLRGVLVGVYVLLIALLLLFNCDGNRHTSRDISNDRDAVEAAEEIGGDGDIKITLLWDFPGDVDLHVIQPNGRELCYRNMEDSRTGGKLDVDNREGGRGSAENIFWTRPARGRYVVSVDMYRIDSAAPNGGHAKVVVKVNGRSQTYDVTLMREGQRVNVTAFDYDPDAMSGYEERDTVAV